jgi:DNA replicative helicase MCM subunit Mcm2 (Cdc46/Mcm family)
MKKTLTLLALCFSFSAFCQQSTLDIAGIHQLIDQSKSEHTLQVNARNQQAVNTANEQANLTLLDKMKNMYRTLQERYNALGTAINIADIGIYATPMVNRIVSNQSQIISLAQKNPAIIALGYQTEIEFAEKAESLLGYVSGLVLSLGDVNQMKASDRKLLFDYVISELSRLQELSGNMLTLLQYNNLSSVIKAMNPLQGFINQDKSLVQQIMGNAKYLGQ